MEAKLDTAPRPQLVTSTGDDHAPAFVGAFNSIVARLARAGVPLGPNALLTVRGRKTGEPRTTPVAVIAVGGRRWVQSPFGEVNWVRNLRAAREGVLTLGRRQEPVEAIELRGEDAARFYEGVLGPYIRGQRIRRFLAGLLGLTEVLDDPVGAASRHPVFELRPQPGDGGPKLAL
jgi:deazaflavin-dependent oxidoreductase (nitroreductase family)